MIGFEWGVLFVVLLGVFSLVGVSAYMDYQRQRNSPRQVCQCEGKNPDWEYHHPTGCADHPQAFAMVAGVSIGDAWDRPRTRGGA